ncbi:MAG: PQQ-binding-like beta-propeller repeat protein [Thaumarchaeota archaeon]|nr:PQQ-binding-like beta-propeller repeat protein [Nitrososphaerota archaeon]
MINSRWLLLSVSVIAILVSSTVFVAIPITPRASAQPVAGANWEYINYDRYGTNSNPQTQINKENVQFLELKWMYPYPQSSSVAAKLKGVALSEGSGAPPLIVNGIVYTQTNYDTILALDATTGKQLWSFTEEVDAAKVLASGAIASIGGHHHGIHYVDGVLLQNGWGCSVNAIDPLNGKLLWSIQDMCKDVPTNKGFYSSGGSHPPAIYKKDNILIWGVGGATEGGLSGRTFVAGYDLNSQPAKLLWRSFLQPPTGGDPDWAVRVRDKGWIQGPNGPVKASEIPIELLKDDWGKMPFGVGMSNLWGQYTVDQETGIAYVGTSQPGQDWNATFRPGPNLFGDSIVALNARNGELVWFYQTTAHDLWDWDCSWVVILGNVSIEGKNTKVIIKACKNGYVFVLDAATGKPYWTRDLMPNSRCKQCFLLDPKNPDDMKKNWFNQPSKGPEWANPPNTGAIESDVTFDGKTIFVGAMNQWKLVQVLAVPFPDLVKRTVLRDRVITRETGDPERPTNTTVFALDAATGNIKWKFTVGGVPHRGGVMATGGVVYYPSADGTLYILDADTGKLLSSKLLGAGGLTVQPIIGADANGKMKVLQVMGGRVFSGFGSSSPGAIMAFGLPDKLPQPADVAREALKQVPKEELKDVLKDVPKEALSQVAPSVETVSPISYGIVGVGIVLIVIAGVLFTRRKKA